MTDYTSFIYFLYWIWRSHFRCIAFIFLQEISPRHRSRPSWIRVGSKASSSSASSASPRRTLSKTWPPSTDGETVDFKNGSPRWSPKKMALLAWCFQIFQPRKRYAKNAANIRMKDSQSIMIAMWGHYSSWFCCDVILGYLRVLVLDSTKRKGVRLGDVTILTILKFTQSMGTVGVCMFGPPAVWTCSRKCLLLLW